MSVKAVIAGVVAGDVLSTTLLPTTTAPASSAKHTETATPADYEPTPESLARHESPQWFNDAKLGFFIHWGPYSVPAYAPPDGGAKYFVLTSKHHDGVALWDSDTTDRDTMALGPRRDFVSELLGAADDYPLRKGLYYSLAEWYHPAGGWVPPRGHSLQEGPVNPYTGQATEYTGYKPVDDDVMDHQYPQMRELVDKFDPDIFWCDIGEHVPNNSDDFLAYYFNQAQNQPNPKDVTVNDRCGTEAADFTTPEYTSHRDINEAKWEATRGIGHSFGYNAQEDVGDYLTSADLIHSFVDIVSKNGNLLLNIGPKADGSIPDIQAERGLDINGEAIYGSTFWAHADDENSDVPVRHTVQAIAVYATALAWPDEELTLSGDLPLAGSSRVTLLGSDGEPLNWTRENGRVIVTMPEEGAEATQSRHAYTFKIATPGTRTPLHTDLDIPAQPGPGEPFRTIVTVTNPGDLAAPAARVRLRLPDEWSATPSEENLAALLPDESRVVTFTVTPPRDAVPARYPIVADIAVGRVSYQPADSLFLTDLLQVIKPDKLSTLSLAETGVRPYVDRDWSLTELPAELSGDVLIPGANDDKRRTSGPMSVVDERARVAGGDVTLARTGKEWADYTYEVTVRPNTRARGGCSAARTVATATCGSCIPVVA